MYVELVGAESEKRLLHRIEPGASFPINFGRELCLRTRLVLPDGVLTALSSPLHLISDFRPQCLLPGVTIQ